MKTAITKTLIQFILIIILLGIVFRISLSSILSDELWNYVYIPPLLYFILMFITGWYFGKKEYEYLPINDIGFRFHLSTYITFFLVSYSMFYLGLMSKHEPKIILDYTLLLWSIALLIHLFFYLRARKNSIKGLDKEEIFE